jgi:hypothetical protein
LRRLPFRRLGLSYVVNELCDWMGIIALSVLVFEQTGSAIAMAAFFLGTGCLPAVLPCAFWAVDRSSAAASDHDAHPERVRERPSTSLTAHSS